MGPPDSGGPGQFDRCVILRCIHRIGRTAGTASAIRWSTGWICGRRCGGQGIYKFANDLLGWRSRKDDNCAIYSREGTFVIQHSSRPTVTEPTRSSCIHFSSKSEVPNGRRASRHTEG